MSMQAIQQSDLTVTLDSDLMATPALMTAIRCNEIDVKCNCVWPLSTLGQLHMLYWTPL